MVGLLLFSASIIAFGFGTDIVTLDALRFVQGIACGCIWSGGLTWVIAVAPRERRGELLGSVIAAAIFGTILGPVMGTAAVALGTDIVFIVAWARSSSVLRRLDVASSRSRRRPGPGGGAPLRALLSSPHMLLGLWLVLLEAGTLGALGTLLPLRLSRIGASGVAVGIAFVLASVLSTLVAPAIGRVTDRRGAGLPLCAGLLTTAVLLLLMPVPHTVFLLAAVTVITVGDAADRLHDPRYVGDHRLGRAHRDRGDRLVDVVQHLVGGRRDNRGTGGGGTFAAGKRFRMPVLGAGGDHGRDVRRGDGDRPDAPRRRPARGGRRYSDGERPADDLPEAVRDGKSAELASR